MDEQNHNNNSSPPNTSASSRTPFRVRRPSSSLISSTTSPIMNMNGNIPNIPNPSNRAFSIRLNIQANNNNPPSNMQYNLAMPMAPTADEHEDVHEPSSSTSSSSSSFNNNYSRRNQRSASPLGSPDTTYHWAQSPLAGNSSGSASGSGIVHQDHNGPPTPGGPCVSSTTDDISPPSPLSPEPPIINHNHRSLNISQFRINSIPSPVPPPQPVMLPPPPLPLPNSNRTSSENNSNNNRGSETVEIVSQNSSSVSNFCSSIALNSMSPLKNKIKKASSFERFSAQASALSRTEQIEPNNSDNSSNSAIPGPSRLIWEYQQNLPEKQQQQQQPTKFVSSIQHETTSSSLITKQPFHIKKLAAKLANVIEQSSRQQQQNQQQLATEEPEEISPEPSPLIRRQLSESPLNLTDSGSGAAANESAAAAVAAAAAISIRNPTITNPTKSFLTKNLPMTPKQKLLQRMQSGEIIIPSSNTPPPQSQLANPSISISLQVSSPSPPPPPPQSHPHPQIQESQQQQILINNSYANQQQQQHHLMIPNLMDEHDHDHEHEGPSSPNMNMCHSSVYESFIRSTTAPGDEHEQDLLDQMDQGDRSSVENVAGIENQILYDPGDIAYPYGGYYGNLQLQGLPEDFFSSANGNVGNSNILRNSLHYSEEASLGMPMHSNNPHLEFCDPGQLDDEHCHSPDDSMQMQMPMSMSMSSIHHPQFLLDPAEINQQLQLQFAKSHQSQQQQQQQCGTNSNSNNDSTLRNLLMMDSLSRNNDDSWISIAAASASQESSYHNSRFSSSTSANGGCGSSSSSGLRLGLSNGIAPMNMNPGNNWVTNESSSVNCNWPRNLAMPPWQGQSDDPDCDPDQDEVMDMSVMDIEKAHSSNNSRHQQQQQQQFSSTGGDLPQIPLIFNSSSQLPLDLQNQTHYTVSHSHNHKKTQFLDLYKNPIDLQHQQQQHRNLNSYEDNEPVNLMSASASLVEQALTTHRQFHNKNNSNSVSSSPEDSAPEIDLVLSSQNTSDTEQQQQQYENSISQQSAESNILFTTTSTTSTTVTTAGFEGVLQLPDTIEERRIIRVPKKYEQFLLEQSNNGNIAENSSTSGRNPPLKQANLVLDKPVQPKSHASIPSILSLEPISISPNLTKFKVIATERIPADTRFGPVEGPVTTLTRDDLNLVLSTKDYPAFLMVDNLNTLLQVDKSDDKYCNWMKHTRLAQSSLEQNAFIYEEKGLLYFTTCKDIPPKTELKVGYGADYAYKYKLSSLEFDPTVIETETENQIQEQHQIPDQISNNPEEEEVERISRNFSCLECDLVFCSEDQLGKHIYSDHNDNDGFRKPKKKAIKVYNSLKQSLAAGMEKENNLLVKRQAAESSSISNNCNSNSAQPSPAKKAKKTIPTAVPAPPLKNQNKDQDLQEESSPIVGSTSGSGDSKPLVILTSGNKVKCGTCYKVFATRERLDKHSIVHSKEFQKPLECQYCSKRFLTNSALAGHAKSHKEVGNSFECPLCSFVTQGLSKLKDHVPVHRDEMGEFTCPYCPQKKKFPAYPLIRKHIRAFHGPRLFGCSSCDKRFPNADKLKLHELKHSNFKAYLCAECGKQFKRKDKLADHMRKSHAPGKQPLQLSQVSAAQTTPFPPNSSKDKFDDKKFTPRLTAEELIKYTFRCTDCMRGFRRRGMLVNHLAKRHPEKSSSDVPELNMPITRPAKNFECLYCDKIYKSSSKRKCHIQKNHPGREIPPPSRGKDKDKDLTSLLESSKMNMNMNIKGIGLEALKKTVNQVIRKETIVGKIIGVPHPCEWCYRQYATRAKLLQHQRKQHYELMPKDMQMPRTQKNNVMKSANEDSASNILISNSISTPFHPKKSKVKKSIKKSQQQQVNSSSSTTCRIGIPPDHGEPVESSTSTSIVSTSTAIAPENHNQNQPQVFSEENVIGYLVTTSGGGSADLRLLNANDIVMGIIPNNNSAGQNSNTAASDAAGQAGAGTTKTITVCIPPGTNLSDANAYITQMISNGIVNGGNHHNHQIITTTTTNKQQ